MIWHPQLGRISDILEIFAEAQALAPPNPFGEGLEYVRTYARAARPCETCGDQPKRRIPGARDCWACFVHRPIVPRRSIRPRFKRKMIGGLAACRYWS